MKDLAYHPTPAWLTREYMEDVLRKYKKDNLLHIIRLELKPATAKGENYASVMTRIKLLFQVADSRDVHEGSYIAKTSFEGDEYLAYIHRPYETFRTEMLMYEKILPALKALLAEIKDEDKLFADTIYVDYKHTAIIFEDLAVKNYAIADRLLGYDVQQAKLALRKLAKMHATAAVFNERVPGVLTQLDHGIFNRHTKGFAPFFENLTEECANYAGECAELGSYYKEKLLKLKDRIVEYSTRVYETAANEFCTLIHGDFWSNNIMLRYCNTAQTHEKSLKDMLLIDLQFSCWTSPAVDLHYLFNNSLQHELRLRHQDELIQYYYEVLTRTLRTLKYSAEIPTLHAFRLQMEARHIFAVTATLVTQPMMINDRTEDVDFKYMLLHDEHSKNFRRLLYSNKNVRQHVKDLLPIFDRKGLLDVQD